MNIKKVTITSLALLFFSNIAAAASVVLVDTDPLTTGIQSSLTTTVGSSFTVDIAISGIDALTPLNAFEFDLDFSPSVLAATSIASGNFLPLGFGFPPTVVESDIAAPDANYAEATIGAGGSSGSGILASITFDVIGSGFTILNLNDVVLSAAFGTPITLDDFNNATIAATTAENPATVPVPPAVLLFMTGLASMRIFARKQRQG